MKSLLPIALFLFPLVATANPKPLPFSYGYPTSPAGHLEIEQYIDTVPMRISRELPSGDLEAITTLRFDLQTEFEIGITDRLEFGFYLTAKQGGDVSPTLHLDGIKQRLRYRFAEAGEWPVDVGVYLEIAELFDELEFEQKILLSKRFGRAVVVANLWVEQEYVIPDQEWEFLFNPTAGFSYELTPAISLGGEYWARGEFKELGDMHHYLGPTLLLQKGEYWLSVAAYARLDGLGESAVVGDPYGKMWVRVILGLGL